MALTDRENTLRTITMTGPEWIPCRVAISDAAWDQWRQEMEEVVARHPLLFPNFKKGQRDYDNYQFAPAHRAGERFTDAWGCVWRSEVNGIEGVVIEHPLADWEALETYKVPNPLETGDRGPVDWDQTRRNIQAAKERGELTTGGVPHGFLFMRLTYLRGFENLMVDMALEDPRLAKLIDMVTEHNEIIVKQWIDMKVDVVVFAEDLGMQTASVISPDMFRKWILPSYERLIKPCRAAGCHAYLHSDGHVLELADDLIGAGINILNLQDLCNGVREIERQIKGRVCIDLDVDRQKIVPFGTPKEIDELIEEEVRVLGSPQGGLMLLIGIYPPTPPENVDAVCSAFEKYRTYWWDRH